MEKCFSWSFSFKLDVYVKSKPIQKIAHGAHFHTNDGQNEFALFLWAVLQSCQWRFVPFKIDSTTEYSQDN